MNHPSPPPFAADAGDATRAGALPVVLVPACNRMLGEHPFHVAGKKYIDAVRLAGALPLVIPTAEDGEIDALLALADGVFLTGSPSNVHPGHFGEDVLDDKLPLDPQRDAWTLPLIRRCLALGIPLLAICRGLQETNVALGGSLLQAVQATPGHDDHRGAGGRADADAEALYGPAHPVDVVPGGLLEQVLGDRSVIVNSVHGQGVGRLADGLRVEARAPDGLVEAFSMPSAPAFNLCVQWHPEWQAADNPVSRRLLRAFGAACRRARGAQRAAAGGGAAGGFRSIAIAAGRATARCRPGSSMVSRDNFTFSELEQWLDENRVTEIECLVPDLTGVARGKIMPREKFTEDRGMRLPEAVVAMGVTGEFPTEGPYFDVISPTDQDMHLRPDPSTVRIVPWATDPTAQVIHDCFDKNGKLIPFAPRSVLRHVCDLFAAEGWEPVVAPELEFYLVARNTDPDVPLKAPIGRSGRAETSRQAYSIDAVNEFDPLFEDVYAYCEKMQLNVDTLIHEIGAGPDGDQLLPRPSARAGRRGVLLQAHAARGGVAPRHVRHLHGQADRRRAGQLDAHAPEPAQQGDRAQYLQQRGRQREPRVLLVHRRPAEIHPVGDGAVRAVRQQLPPAGALERRADQYPVGHRQPHRGHPLAGGHAGRAAHREPRQRRRRESVLSRWRRRWPAATSASRTRSSRRPNARATPTSAISSCRAASARRWRCCARTPTSPMCSARPS